MVRWRRVEGGEDGQGGEGGMGGGVVGWWGGGCRTVGPARSWGVSEGRNGREKVASMCERVWVVDHTRCRYQNFLTPTLVAFRSAVLALARQLAL